MTTFIAHYPSPLGPLVGAAEDGAVTGLWFEGQRYFPSFLEGVTSSAASPDSPVLRDLGGWLEAYFAGANPAVTFPLAPRGTPFRQAVWEALREVPYGVTTTYGELAARLSTPGKKPSARAIGGAVGHNPISLVIPCHRVLGAGGALTGYAAGLDRKRALLQLEGAL
jgi:methylated-DNA-[protein]-cysteine S-methyltransferase